jgi:lipid-A-disaccharide synthase-like uncharacterized protein
MQVDDTTLWMLVGFTGQGLELFVYLRNLHLIRGGTKTS